MTTLFLCITINVWTQVTTTPTGRFKSLPPIARSSSTTASDINTISWNIVFETLPNAGHKKLFHVNEVKELKNKAKRNMPSPYPLSESSSKTAASAPSIGINFKGNELKSWTPTDNTIAISNGGKIVSCVNYGIDYYDTVSGSFSVSQTWNAFINDTTLNSAKFDPRVIYDKLHDRFIVVLLHGFTSAKSKILVCFSKTNNPVDGWHIYNLSGNPFGNNAWTDFPTIGVNEHELFINGNQFGDAPLYAWKGTYIYQINLQEGYNGDPLLSGIWDGISTPGGLDGITLYPASHGLGDSMYQQMYFAQLMPDSGSMVYLYRIKGLLSDTNKTMTAFEYPIPSYEVCGTAYQRDPNSLIVDSLSTGSAWTQNAFYLNNMVHFAFGANVGGWCGIHYGRIDLDSGKAEVKSFSEAGTDLCYPAVASLGYDSTDRSVGIAYVRSDSVVTILPETGVISVDHQMNFSVLQTVKKEIHRSISCTLQLMRYSLNDGVITQEYAGITEPERLRYGWQEPTVPIRLHAIIRMVRG
jgi:hypothetical protein